MQTSFLGMVLLYAYQMKIARGARKFHRFFAYFLPLYDQFKPLVKHRPCQNRGQSADWIFIDVVIHDKALPDVDLLFSCPDKAHVLISRDGQVIKAVHVQGNPA